MVLLDAYEHRRRRELGDLWRVMVHAQHAPEKPEDALPPAPAREVMDEMDVEPGGFDPAAMVRQAQDMQED